MAARALLQPIQAMVPPVHGAKKMLVVFVKRRAIVILPDSDVDLGELGPVDDIRVMSQMTPQGRTWSAVKTPAKEIQVSS
jgi:hypothetical protein